MKMKRNLTSLLVVMVMGVSLLANAFVYAAEATTEASSESFNYKHDPTKNESAMEDIIVNPDAVYGFSPNPESKRLGSFAEYDWTDPDVVADCRKSRSEYHEEMESMVDMLYSMREEGKSLEEMARAVSIERNKIRAASYKDDPEGLAKMKQSNLETYGHEEGPTPDELYEKYGSWEIVLQKAFSPNLGMDACCGLYDEYYDFYVELGLAEPDPEQETSTDVEKPTAFAAD